MVLQWKYVSVGYSPPDSEVHTGAVPKSLARALFGGAVLSKISAAQTLQVFKLYMGTNRVDSSRIGVRTLIFELVLGNARVGVYSSCEAMNSELTLLELMDP